MRFPDLRPRRLRANRIVRNMVAETTLDVDDLVAPIFVSEKSEKPEPIEALPGIYRWTLGTVAEHAKELVEHGLNKLILFGIPAEKDEVGSSAYAPDGIVQKTLRLLRRELGDKALLITDVCLCQYTTHGHCGLLSKNRRGETIIDNDKSIEVMARVAVSHAEAGADMVAPSNMMDGVVGAIRRALDKNGYPDVVIMSYAVKYASSFYGPFREAAESAPAFGDRRSDQMDPRNAYEAIKEAGLDVEEGADILMVKPALPYLNVIRLVKSSFPHYPLAAYSVSGEYSMIKAAAEKGWIDERTAVLEVLHAIKRAGADIIITYYALEAAKLLRNDGRYVF